MINLYNYRNIILVFLALIYLYYNSLINKKYIYVFLTYVVLALYINFTDFRFLCFFAILCLSIYHLYLDSRLYKGGNYTADLDLENLLNGGDDEYDEEIEEKKLNKKKKKKALNKKKNEKKTKKEKH